MDPLQKWIRQRCWYCCQTSGIRWVFVVWRHFLSNMIILTFYSIKNTLPHPVDLGLTDPTRQKSVITGMRERDGKRYTTYLAPSSKPRKLLGRTGVPGIYKLLNWKIAKTRRASQTRVYHSRVKHKLVLNLVMHSTSKQGIALLAILWLHFFLFLY